MIDRRAFLKTSVLAGAGLSLGLSLEPSSRALAAASANPALHNAWLRIGTDNAITLVVARSEMGQGVYTALPMLLAEELDVDLDQVNVVMAPPDGVYVNSMLGAQITGGSTSVRDAWDKLRFAGAQARQMLVQAAAMRWRVDPAVLRTARASVIGPGDRKATYGELADEAAKLTPPKDIVLRKSSAFRLIGRTQPRLDTPPKVNGSARFGIDVQLPDMVYASLEQCPVIGGRVLRVDAVQARAMEGVIDVVRIPDGVAVVAKSYWQAFKARQALVVEWDEGSVAGLDNAVMRNSIRRASEDGSPMKVKRIGDPVKALQGPVKLINAEYESPLLAHAAMEPMNFTAHYHDGRCDLIGPTQFQQGGQSAVASALGIRPEDVTLETTFLGGGFGRRLEVDYMVQAAQISRAVGRPVKLIWTREDDTTHDFYRPMALHRMQGGLDADGKLIALTFQMTSQSITQRAFGLPKDQLDPFMAEAAVVPYAIPNMAQDIVVHDAGLRVGYWRSVSHALNAFANESFIDELAAAAGKDPYAFRLAMLSDQPRLLHVAKLAAEKAGWGKKLEAGRHLGIALMEGYDSYLAQVVEISTLANQVTVHRVVVAADVGQMVNPDTVLAQIQSSIIFGVAGTLYGEVTLEKGRVQQTNFHNYRVLRMNEIPRMDIVLVPSTEKPGGIGEPVTAMVAPAIANALFAGTGKRVRKLPLNEANLAGA
ncbi:xanthine dehydrogenase family protein molybdopterin-binding subunit [Cupriavidus sp. 2SB]|uniref:xanthine dehydrogenase family protein molybdopterin-binding subunit n=1 Tax=Cupriavidus sp. 2SB TaxID=2502199 RepID=UPI0010F55562|nr:xanthine dehydrogenase family protein molybdopterin-binding subunit [Cupriavidus sp. 2SB]